MGPMTTAKIDSFLSQYDEFTDDEKEQVKLRMDDGWKPTEEQMDVILRRSQEIEDGTAKTISMDELRTFMEENRKRIRENARRKDLAAGET